MCVFSGKFVVRVPKTLHATLARVAEDEGVSLNQFVVGALSSAVEWRAPVAVDSVAEQPGKTVTCGYESTVVVSEMASPRSG